MYRQSSSRLLLGQVLLEKASRCCRAVPDGASACRAASHGALALPRRDLWRVNLDALHGAAEAGTEPQQMSNYKAPFLFNKEHIL
jgi:hypothetical protein